MRKTFLTIICPLLGWLAGCPQTPAIGNWRDHLPYHEAVGVTGSANGSGKVYCATPYSFFSVDPSDKSITRFSKTNGLSETGVSAICLDSASGKIIVAYNSSNIDLVSGSSVANVPDLARAPLPENKTIYRINTQNGLAYLSTGFGIVVVDEDKNEVKDTYVIGSTGDSIAVWSLVSDGLSFYAATAEGLKAAPLSSPDLADFHSWSVVADSSGACHELTVLGGRVLTLKNDSVFQLLDDTLRLFYTDGAVINDISVSEGRLLLCEQQGGAGTVLQFTGPGAPVAVIHQPGLLVNPRQAFLLNGITWVADGTNGLIAWDGTGPESFVPNSPLSLSTGDMVIRAGGGLAGPGFSGTVWSASGGTDADWNPLGNHNGLYSLNEEGWKNYNASGYPVFDSIYDFASIAINPADTSTWAGSFGEGLLEWKPGDIFTIYNQSNSGLGTSVTAPGACRVAGLSFDASGNLWIANYGAANELVLRTAAGNWQHFSVPFAIAGNAVSQVLTDNYRQIWIVSPGGNGVLCYAPGALLDDPSDDRWKFYQTGAGNGNLPDAHVNCLAKDKNGFIWVGTMNGIGVIQCAQNVFTANACPAVWPIVQFDNFAGYLFSGQDVQTIAVDGADRKWVGTNNGGVWLISPDATQIIYHFTADSTPLLSNDVRKIAIDPLTGEVFFTTAAGICSFRSTATEGGSTNSNVLVFPNPVPPSYSGTIAIRGLVDGAIVKITALDGRLVYQTNALGGQAVWDGRDYKGRTALGGVYLVLVSDTGGNEKIVTKIVIIK